MAAVRGVCTTTGSRRFLVRFSFHLRATVMSLQKLVEQQGGLTAVDIMFLAQLGMQALFTGDVSMDAGRPPVQPDAEPNHVYDGDTEEDFTQYVPSAERREFIAQTIIGYCTNRRRLNAASIECHSGFDFQMLADGCAPHVELTIYSVGAPGVAALRSPTVRVLTIMKPLQAAAEDARDGELDIVSIAQTGTPLEAIMAWEPKVCRTGFIIGGRESVEAAREFAGEVVDEFAGDGWMIRVGHYREMVAQRQAEIDTDVVADEEMDEPLPGVSR